MKKIQFISMIQVLAWIILFSACKQGGTGEAYTIKMRLQQGDKFSQDMDMTMNMEIAILNMKMKMETGYNFEVMNSSGDTTNLKMTYNKLRMSMEAGKMGPGKGVQDSMLNKVNDRLVGKNVYLKLDKNNKIVDVEGLREMMQDSTLDSLSRTMTEKMFSKETLNNSMSFMFSMYPNKPVRVGDTWKGSTVMTMAGMDMNIDATYTLNSVKDGLADVGIDSKVSGKGSVGGSNGMKINMTGNQNGNLYIKLTDGYLKHGKFKMDLSAGFDVMGSTQAMKIKADCIITGK